MTVWVILAQVGCLFSTHMMSVGVRQYTQDVRGIQWLSISTNMTSVDVRVCPWVSANTHRTSVAVRQHTQDVRVCPSAYTGHPCVRQHTQDIRVCPCVSVSTNRTSVAVHQYLYLHAGPWTQHAGPSRGLFLLFWPTLAVYSVHTGRPWVSTSTHRTSVCVRQHTQDVRG